ncbi:MAG: hypothetical protein KBI20_09360 [Sedimentibacter sp.]|nr:hypothetical protein [Sedimentibacter sp.]
MHKLLHISVLIMSSLLLMLPLNVMAIDTQQTVISSNYRQMVHEVFELNSQTEFRLKIVNAFDPFPKGELNDMRQEYNLQYTSILTKHGFAVENIYENLNSIWREVGFDITKRSMWIMMLVSPGLWDFIKWEAYKAKVLDFTRNRFKMTMEAKWNISSKL